MASISAATSADPELTSARIVREKYEFEKSSHKSLGREHCPILQPLPQLMPEVLGQPVKGLAAESTCKDRKAVRKETSEKANHQAEKCKCTTSDAAISVCLAQFVHRDVNQSSDRSTSPEEFPHIRSVTYEAMDHQNPETSNI